MPDALNFDYFKNCVHCGLCLPNCPTYRELRDENDSPRGRIYLMQAVAEGRVELSAPIQRHLDLCLDCRACESVCPSGVQYGALFESFRAGLRQPGTPAAAEPRRWIDRLCAALLPHRNRTRWLLGIARAAEAAGLAEFAEQCGVAPGHVAALRLAGRLAAAAPDPPPVESSPAGPTSTRVGLFLGCVGEFVLGATNRAALRVLLRNGAAVNCPRGQRCCGAIHYHSGDAEGAKALARRNIDAFEKRENAIEAIVVTAAGCGLMLKEYGNLLASDPAYARRALRFSSRVADITEFLDRRPLKPPGRRLALRVTYHEACHLCHGQRIRQQPRRMLRAIPGLELLEMAESDWCCGAAGTYGLRQPEMAARLADRKLGHIDDTSAQTVAVANPGCILHLMQHADRTGRVLKFVHPVDLLDMAYDETQDQA